MAKRRANGEGSIFQRKDGLWAAQYTDNVGKKRTLYGKTQQIVRNKLKEAIKQSDKGLLIDKGNTKFADWLKEWLEVYKKPVVRESSYQRDYARIYHHIIPAFPKVLLKDLRADGLQKFFNEKAVGGRLDGKEGGLSIAELHKIRQIIIAALFQAVDNQMIISNPAKKIKLPPHVRDEVKALSISDQQKLEKVVVNHYNPLAFSILLDLYTGLRIGELVALQLKDINFNKNELTVQRSNGRIYLHDEKQTKKIMSEPKTAKGRRVIPIPIPIMERLKVFIEERNKMVDLMRTRWSRNTDERYSEHKVNGEWVDEGFLFLSISGTTTDKTNLTRIFNQCLKEAGVEHINFHAIRHTFATRCLEAGFDIRTLSDILGHMDAKMTLNTYTHALSDQKRTNMDKLSLLYDNNLDSDDKKL